MFFLFKCQKKDIYCWIHGVLTGNGGRTFSLAWNKQAFRILGMRYSIICVLKYDAI